MWVLIVIAAALALWGLYRVLRPGRRRPWGMSPDTARTRIEGGMILGRDWKPGPDRYR